MDGYNINGCYISGSLGNILIYWCSIIGGDIFTQMKKAIFQSALILIFCFPLVGIAGTVDIQSPSLEQMTAGVDSNALKQSDSLITLTQEERDWLKAHPRIIMGTLEYPPFVIKNSGGILSGIAVEFAEMINQRLGINIKLDCSFSWPETQQKAQRREIDGLFPSIANLKERIPYFLFSDEVFSSDIYVYTSKRVELSLNSLADLAGMRVGYQEGVVHLKELLQKYPGISTATFPSINAMLNALLEGRIDAVIGHANIQHALLQKAIQVKLALVVPERSRAVVYTVRKDWPELVRILNKGIATIQPDERTAILSKWLIKAEEPAGEIRLTAREKAWLDKHPVIRLGYTPHAEPLLIRNKDGSYNGIFPEIFEVLEHILGIRFEIELGEWSPIVQKARNLELDGLLACAPIQAEASKLLRTQPIHMTYPIVFTRKDAPFMIKSINDLKGKRIAYQKEIKMLEVLLDQFKKTSEIIPVINTLDAIELVLNGKADVAFAISFKNYLVVKHALDGVKVAYFDLEHTNPICTGIRKDWPELVGILNKGLEFIGRERIHNILAKWTGISAQPPMLELTPEEQAWINAHPVIRIAGDFAAVPLEFIGDNNEYTGLAVDYMRTIGSMLGVRFEFDRMPQTELLKRARNREVDMIGCISRTPEREKYLLFTDPYITMPIGIFTGQDVTYIGSMKALTGKKVAVVKDYAIHELLAVHHPEIIAVPVADIQEGLRLLTNGEVYAYLGNMLTTGHMISQKGYTNIRVVRETPYTYSQAIGVNPDLPVLRNILQKALDNLSEEKKNSLAKKWVLLIYEHGFDYAVVWKILAGAVLVICGFFYWNRMLKAQVRKQTASIRLNEDALRQSEEKHKQAQKMAHIGHWEFNHKTEKLSWSEEVYRIFDVDISKFRPSYSAFIDKVHPNDRDFVHKAFSDSVKNKTEYDIIHRIIFRQGKVKYIHERCNTSYDSDGNPRRSMGTVQDVTLLKEAELSKKKVEEQLRQAQKMEAIGTLAGGIAHDFNNILSIIIGYAELAKEDINKPKTLVKDINEVLNASDRAKNLVSQILTFSRKTEQKRQALQISSVVKESLKLLRSSIPSTIEIRQEIKSESLVLADPTQVHQIIMNLCTNAYHAMRESGGTLGLTLKDVEISEADFIPELEVPFGRYLKLEVSDTGIGMDEETKVKIFDPYFTTKGLGEGTGLGLAVVHGVVKDHGGFLKVYSEVGRGTVFHVFLPAHQGEEGSVTQIKQSITYETNGDETIIFVDDDGKIAEVVTRSLQAHGYKVLSFTNGIQALQEFQQQPDKFDLVITDMTMPFMTGIQLSQELLEIRADIPIILCTGHSELTNREKSLVMGIKEYLEKPLSIDYLLYTVRKVLDCSQISGLRILFIDNIRYNVVSGKKILKRLGCEVVGLTSAQEAIDILRKTPNGFDLILTDHDIPNMTGFELADNLNKINPDIPIFLVSEKENIFDNQMEKLNNIKKVLKKPLKEDILVNSLISILKTNSNLN